MKKIIMLSLLIGSLSFNASAQTKKEKIVQLLDLMQSDKMINSMFDNVSNMFKKQASGLKDAQDAKNDSIQEVFMKYVMEETKALTKRLINEDMVEIYDKYFTDKEIQKYIDFYKTPEGKKFLDQMPNIQTDMMNTLMGKYLPELQEKFKKKLEELKKK
jgi:hypothetical protein